MRCTNFTTLIMTESVPDEEIPVPSYVLTVITPIVVVVVIAIIVALIIGTALVYRMKVKKLKSR